MAQAGGMGDTKEGGYSPWKVGIGASPLSCTRTYMRGPPSQARTNLHAESTCKSGIYMWSPSASLGLTYRVHQVAPGILLMLTSAHLLNPFDLNNF